MSISSTWRVCMTRVSTAEVLAMWVASLQLIMQTNIESGSRVTLELSPAVLGQRSGWRDRVLRPVREVPGTWINFRS